MKAKKKYLRQSSSYPYSCWLYALSNALIHEGYKAPRPGLKQWESLVEECGCRYGTPTRLEPALEKLGIRTKHHFGYKWNHKDFQKESPIILTVKTVYDKKRDRWYGSHYTLLIAAYPKRAKLVNFRCSDGPTVELVPWDELQIIEAQSVYIKKIPSRTNFKRKRHRI